MKSFVLRSEDRRAVIRRSRLASLVHAVVWWTVFTVPCALLAGLLAFQRFPGVKELIILGSYAVVLAPLVVLLVAPVREAVRQVFISESVTFDRRTDMVTWNGRQICRMDDVSRIEIVVSGRQRMLLGDTANLYLVDRQQRRRVALGSCSLTEARELAQQLHEAVGVASGVV